MAVVASLGESVFSVSDRKIITMSNVSSQITARYAQHDRHLKKPLLEFLGPGLDSYTFDVVMSVWLGVNPTREMLKLKRMADEGRAERFIVGGSIKGSYKWVVEKIGRSKYIYDRVGNVKTLTVSVTIKEYTRR